MRKATGKLPAKKYKWHRPTPETRAAVAAMASVGAPQPMIARRLNVDDKTLRKHYANELAEGRQETLALMASTLVQLGRKGNVAAVIFYLKTQGGWRETDAVEVGPVNLVIQREPPSVTPAPAAGEASVVGPTDG